jgi:Fic family protein
VFDLALAQGATFHSARTSPLWAVSPVILKKRKEYYAQLESAQKGDLDITSWLEWSVASVELACDEARVCIERVVRVAQFWTRHRDTPFNSRQRRLLEIALGSNDEADAWLTAKRAARVTKVERVTASRDLSRLEALGVIEKDPSVGGRSTRYRVRLADPQPVQLIKQLKWT